MPTSSHTHRIFLGCFSVIFLQRTSSYLISEGFAISRPWRRSSMSDWVLAVLSSFNAGESKGRTSSVGKKAANNGRNADTKAHHTGISSLYKVVYNMHLCPPAIHSNSYWLRLQTFIGPIDLHIGQLLIHVLHRAHTEFRTP